LGDNLASQFNGYRRSWYGKQFDCNSKLLSLVGGDLRLKESPALLVNIHMD